MTSPHKRAPHALLEYLETGREPVRGVDYLDNPLDGLSRNLDKEYVALAIIAGDRRNRWIDWCYEVLDDELNVTGLCATENGSSTYESTHVVFHQVLQSLDEVPSDLRDQNRVWIDRLFSVNTLTSSANRRDELGRLEDDRLRVGVLVRPPGQRNVWSGGGPGREARWRYSSSWCYMILAGRPYHVRRPPLDRATGSEVDCMCLERMGRDGTLYHPQASVRYLEEALLATPFRWCQAGGEWDAQMVRPFRVPPNPNNVRIEHTRGSTWHPLHARLAAEGVDEVVVGGESDGHVIEVPGEVDRPPRPMSATVPVSVGTLLTQASSLERDQSKANVLRCARKLRSLAG